MEEYKLSKIRTQWMRNNSADTRIREVKPLLRPGRKFRAQNEIDESVAELTFKEAVGWNHLPKWPQASSSVRAVMISQERRRKVEQDRVARAVQQSQHGKWITWEDVMQRSLTWSEYMEDVPAPTCLRNKVRPVAVTICRSGVWWKTPNGGYVAEPRHCITDRRSRPRKDEALSPGADRKWQEVGLGGEDYTIKYYK